MKDFTCFWGSGWSRVRSQLHSNTHFHPQRGLGHPAPPHSHQQPVPHIFSPIPLAREMLEVPCPKQSSAGSSHTAAEPLNLTQGQTTT